MEVSGQLHASAALPQGKNLWYPLDRRLGGSQSRSGRGGEGKSVRKLLYIPREVLLLRFCNVTDLNFPSYSVGSITQ
jgi:hypothetical protein